MQDISGIKLLLMDCDGVLTDGRLYFTARGEEMKVFNVRDGQGLALWHRAGFRSGIISGRDAGDIIKKRAEELGIEFVVTGSRDKVADLEEILGRSGVSASECAFVGDDIGDIEIMKRVGLGIAVADAEAATIGAAGYVTKKNGGYGAIREVVEMLLAAKE
ncbi:MAG: HAD hydrolase family protein [Pyrinomonadaceae bacterium]|nr:HAD hydrolase family protein [Pyrinomonadaceae bacterium]